MVLLVLSTLSATLSARSISQNMTATVFKKKLQAFGAAEAGLDRALQWLRAQPSSPIGNYTNPWGGPGDLTVARYTVTIFDQGVPGGMMGVRRYKVISTGSTGSMTETMTNYLQTDNYARYIWFTDQEEYQGTTVWFWTQDYLNGPTQTNGHFNIYGNPVFAGEVRSADDYITYYNNGHAINSSAISNAPYDIPNFQQGMTFGVDQFNMPTQALNLRAASSSGGLRLLGDTTIVLNSNGTMTVTNSDKHWTNHNMALPANGALFVDSKNGTGGNLTLSGTLKGSLTVGAKLNVNIPSDITYSNDPRLHPASTDVLGIIAEGNVVISSSASNNLEVDASIMALNTSFMLQNWDQGSPKGTLTVYGGIIQDQRGPVGTFNGSTGQKLTGYSKNYSYDQRLLDTPPPFFPTTGDYVTLAWQD